jgi:L-asparaginase
MKGFVEQGRYETSSHLQRYGVWSGGDITFEAAIAKLMFILASPGSEEDREFLFMSNLRGERTNYSAIV